MEFFKVAQVDMSALVKKSGLWVLANVVMLLIERFYNNKLKLLFEFTGNITK
jgi:hypothetical protein